jgi:anaerobic magnesium-protoporphyrin IX monomethyl ester cyclase
MIALINHQGLKVMEGLQLQSPSPPIGLAYIGAYLKQNGLDYTAIDACGLAMDNIVSYDDQNSIFIQGLTVPEVVERVPSNIKIVGFTCLFSHCWPLVLSMAKAIKEKYPNVFMIAGGEHPTALPKLVLESGLFDVVITGEGEETMLELCTRVLANQEWRDILGIAFYKDGELKTTCSRKRVTDIDRFPHPDWDSWCLTSYIENEQVTGINLGRQMPILGSRGCPYACKFCSNEDMWTRRYIMRDPKSLVDEMEYMKKKYQVSGFTFMDSTFVVNRNKTLAFANELIARKLDVTYQLPAGTRCEAFDEELAFALDKSGLRNFAFAPESGSEEILEVIRKQVDLNKMFSAVKTVLKTNMTVACFIVIGFPEDTSRSMRDTLRLIRKLAWMGIHDVTVSQFTPYPGSDYFKELMDNGSLSEDLQELRAVINFYSSMHKSYSKELTSKQLYRWMLIMYLNFYVISFLLRPMRPIKNLWAFLSRGVENTRYTRLFAELFVKRKKWRKTSKVAHVAPHPATVTAK